jgi:hypothetical protein
MATLCWASAAGAQPSFNESFFVAANADGASGEERQGLARCSRSFADILTQSQAYVERNAPEISSIVTSCMENVADPSSLQACDLAAASSSVDYIVMVDAVRTSGGWLFEARAVAPMQNATVWSGDALISDQSDIILAGRQGCRELGQNFLCTRNNTCAAATTAAAERSTLRLVHQLPVLATVRVDGVEIGDTSQREFALVPGTKRVEILAPGYAPFTQTVTLAAGQTLDLQNIQLAALPTTATLRASVAQADVFVNGQPAGRLQAGQPLQVPVPVGSSTLRVVAPGHQPWEVSLAAAQGTDIPLEVTLVPEGAPPQAAPESPMVAAPGPATPGDAQNDSLQPGAVRTGRLQAGDSTLNSGEFIHSYFYRAQAGERVTVYLESREFDPYLLARGPGDFQLDNDDIADGNLNAGLDIVFPSAGEYRIVATTYQPGETGAYTLRVMPFGWRPGGAGVAAPPVQQPPVQQPPVQQPQGGPETVGLSPNMVPRAQQFRGRAQNGTVNAQELRGDCRGWFTDSPAAILSPSQTMDFTVAAESAADTTLIIVGPHNAIFCDDDSGEGLNPLLQLRSAPAGLYRVYVGTYSQSAAADWVVTVDVGGGAQPPVQQGTSIGLSPGMVPRARSVTGNLRPGTVDARSLNRAGCVGWFDDNPVATLSVSQPMNFSVGALSGTDTALIILGPGDQSWCDDDSGEGLNPLVTLQRAPAGTYRVYLGTYNQGGSGSYTLNVEAR